MPDLPALVASLESGPAHPYLQPPPGYFWRWAEQGEVVEWANGTTITYREELAALLAGLAPEGLPPLGAGLLLLAACTHAWQESSAEIGLLQGLLRTLPQGGPPDEELLSHLSVARAFLDTIRQLPPALRQGTAKEQLLRVLLAEDSAPRQVPARLAPPVLAALQAEAQLARRLAPGPPPTRQQLRTDLLYFERATRRFPTAQSLELRLRTGLSELPAPAPDVPAPPPPTEPAADLLTALGQDERTAALARLVPALRAALRLPHTARQAGQQPLGGVADLTNRGPLDRLLLSELAQDELPLLARLANGEALYLRREAPPRPQEPPRLLLLDTTLRQWGTPRVLALAAALALADPPAPPGQSPAQFAGQLPRPPVPALALAGGSSQPLDLRSVPGVVAALELLAPAPHCAGALGRLLPVLPPATEALLILEADGARQPALQDVWATAPATLRFVLTVARSGEVVLYERTGGRRVEVRRAHLDLAALLRPARPAGAALARPLVPLAVPAFLGESVAPLRFPTPHFTPEYDPARGATAAYSAALGLVAIMPDRRVLHWPSAAHGARELLPVVEAGQYWFGFSREEDATMWLLVRSTGSAGAGPGVWGYALPLRPEGSYYRQDLSAKLPLVPWQGVWFADRYFMVRASLRTFWQVNPAAPAPPSPSPFLTPPPGFVNTSHNVLKKLGRVGVGSDGSLLLGNWQLRLLPGYLTLNPCPGGITLARPASSAGASQRLTPSAAVRFVGFAWPDGSTSITDGRGLLHLRSADPGLPEVTLTLVAQTALAAWAADGHRSGWGYLTGPGPEKLLPPDVFYARYIQPFLDRVGAGGEVAAEDDLHSY